MEIVDYTKDSKLAPSLVDVPVRTNIWIRPKCQREQFEVIKKAKPSVLIIKSDGGRNEAEWEAIRENRKLYDTEIDWQCKVYKFYYDVNQGLYASVREVSEFLWKNFDRCIFMEDDDIPSVCFFQFCAAMLEKYKDDKRIAGISGNNPLGFYEEPKADYFFSRTPSIHGMALWKRTFEQRQNIKLNYIDDYYKSRILLMCKEDKLGYYKHMKRVLDTGVDGNHVAAREFFNSFDRYSQSQLYITPTHNLIKNIGYGEDAEHSGNLNEMPGVVRKYIFQSNLYEYNFPLNNPEFVVRDLVYEKKIMYILGDTVPVIDFFRNIEKLFLSIIHGNWKRIGNKIFRMIYKPKEN